MEFIVYIRIGFLRIRYEQKDSRYKSKDFNNNLWNQIGSCKINRSRPPFMQVPPLDIPKSVAERKKQKIYNHDTIPQMPSQQSCENNKKTTWTKRMILLAILMISQLYISGTKNSSKVRYLSIIHNNLYIFSSGRATLSWERKWQKGVNFHLDLQLYTFQAVGHTQVVCHHCQPQPLFQILLQQQYMKLHYLMHKRQEKKQSPSYIVLINLSNSMDSLCTLKYVTNIW